MKRFVEQAQELAKTWTGALKRAIDPPLSSDARPLEIKGAVVDAVERLIEPVGGGRRVLPGGRVQVKILAPETGAQRALKAVLADLHEVIAARLREVRCDLPPGLQVEVGYVRQAPADWAPEQRLSVDLQARMPAGAPRERTTQPILEVTVLKGTASAGSYALADSLIRIGRSEAPTDDRGRSRPNHVAFLDDDTAENKTVTRSHAQIRFIAATGEYRLFDEGSANGTRILRDGRTIDVVARDPIGVTIASGDELQFGRAAVQVRIGSPRGPN